MQKPNEAEEIAPGIELTEQEKQRVAQHKPEEQMCMAFFHEWAKTRKMTVIEKSRAKSAWFESWDTCKELAAEGKL